MSRIAEAVGQRDDTVGTWWLGALLPLTRPVFADAERLRKLPWMTLPARGQPTGDLVAASADELAVNSGSPLHDAVALECQALVDGRCVRAAQYARPTRRVLRDLGVS